MFSEQDTNGIPELIDDEPMTEIIRTETMQELVWGVPILKEEPWPTNTR